MFLKKMFVLGKVSSKPLSYMMKSFQFRYIFFCGDGSLFRVPGRLFQFCEWLLAVSLALCYAVLFWRWNWIYILHNLEAKTLFLFFLKVQLSNVTWLLWYCIKYVFCLFQHNWSLWYLNFEMTIFSLFVCLKSNVPELLKWQWRHQCTLLK